MIHMNYPALFSLKTEKIIIKKYFKVSSAVIMINIVIMINVLMVNIVPLFTNCVTYK